MKLTVIGHGYVGLVTAAVFADLGNTVYCIGRTPQKIDNLKKGIMPIFEPGLKEFVIRNTRSKRLIFTLDYNEAVSQSEIIFICVGTPPRANGEADLTQVLNVASILAKQISNYTVIVCKSTVPVGTNFKIKALIEAILAKQNKHVDFDIASCPEFLREGTALSDTLHPDRIVIGYQTDKAKNALLELHKPIDGSRVLTTITDAEIIKYVSNSLLATKISFANAVSFLCDSLDGDVEKVLEGVGLDRRIGRAFLYPGVGYGGSCFPKDVKALIAQAKNLGYNFNLLKSVEEINERASQNFVNKILENTAKEKNKLIGLLGLAFKPDTDDMRDAPSIGIINSLQKKGYKIQAYDPQAVKNAKKVLNNVKFTDSPYAAANEALALVVVTEWNEFRQLDLKKIKKIMSGNYLFDGRNIYDPSLAKKIGFHYYGVGRK